MRLLKWNTPTPEVLEEFPMLEGMTESELRLMAEDCMYIPEDAPFVRAIQVILKNMDRDEPVLV